MDLATKEIERCVIRAERSGLVIYPTTEEWKNAPDIAEGATVHNDQVLLLMPDLSKMQVKIGIHESMINSINEGMTATVTLPGRTLVGEVTSVASVAPAAEWWTGNIVKYDAIIQLPSVDGLKPGMSAAVEVNIARQENVLLIPVAAVVETEHGYFCWVGSADEAQRCTLQVGASNDDYFVVNAGLQEGDRVVLNPSLFFEEAEIRQSPAPRSPKS
jgi:multidrug efflux pump subunit AcrA (membrane-fusion protein)